MVVDRAQGIKFSSLYTNAKFFTNYVKYEQLSVKTPLVETNYCMDARILQYTVIFHQGCINSYIVMGKANQLKF